MGATTHVQASVAVRIVRNFFSDPNKLTSHQTRERHPMRKENPMYDSEGNDQD